MDRPRKGITKNSKRGSSPSSPKKGTSAELAKRGVNSSEDFRNLMCSMMTDVIQGNLGPDVVNAACNAGRGLLRMVELEYRSTSKTAARRLPMSRRIENLSS